MILSPKFIMSFGSTTPVVCHLSAVITLYSLLPPPFIPASITHLRHKVSCCLGFFHCFSMLCTTSGDNGSAVLMLIFSCCTRSNSLCVSGRGVWKSIINQVINYSPPTIHAPVVPLCVGHCCSCLLCECNRLGSTERRWEGDNHHI